jgi:hypothetical protein
LRQRRRFGQPSEAAGNVYIQVVIANAYCRETPLGINARIKIRLTAEGIPAVQVQQHAATYSGLDFQVMLTYGNTYLIFHE